MVELNPEIDKEIAIESQKYLAKEYVADAKRWGEFDSERWNRFYAWLHENKLIEKEIPKDFGFTNEFLPE